MTFLRLLPALLIVLALAGTAGPHEPQDSAGKPDGRMVYYSGQVQGVGFRAAVREIARDFPVQGWVKNLKDGRVQLLVEGQPQDVMKFLTAVRERWKKNIDKELVEVTKPAGEYRKFTIRY
jgi:acylphosphatase